MWCSKRWRQVASCAALLVTLIGLSLSWARGSEDGKEDLQVIVDEAKRRAAEHPVNVTPGKFADQKRVEAAAATGRARGSEELERRAKAVQERDRAGEDPSQSPAATAKGSKDQVSGRVVVALSSSMPEAMLREYMRQLHDIPEAVVVLRGFVGGARTVAPTGRWVESIRRRQASCRECAHYQVEILVDPLVYRMLDIKQVPAVAYLPGIRDLRHCDAEVLSTSTVVYGAVSIGAALKSLKHDGVSVPSEVLAKFGGA